MMIVDVCMGDSVVPSIHAPALELIDWSSFNYLKYGKRAGVLSSMLPICLLTFLNLSTTHTHTCSYATCVLFCLLACL